MVPPLAPNTGIWFSLVVPTYNESQNVEPLVEEVTRVLDEKFAGKYEIIFADDNSPDGTAERVKSVTGRVPQVRLMVRTGKRGLATAVVRGWQVAQGRILGVMDGDLQHPVSVLPAILEKMEKALILSGQPLYQAGWSRQVECIPHLRIALFSTSELPRHPGDSHPGERSR